MNDVRDEALGRVLDGFARTIDAEVRVEPILREGSRRRALRFTAIGASVAVFVGAVSWAGLTWPRESVRVPPDRVTFQSPDVPWTFSYPSDWRVVATSGTFIETLVSHTRTTIVNASLPAGAGDFSPGDPGNTALTSEVGDRGVIVLVERRWSSYDPISVEEYPRGEGSATDEESPGWTYRWRDSCQGTFCYSVIIWWGPSASDRDLEEAAHVEGSVRLVNEHRWTESGAAGTTLHDEDRGYTVTYPDGWTVADENLTPWLSSPSEILSLGTFPLRVSNDPEDGFRLFDAPVAPAALEDITGRDAFISVQEGTESFGDTRSRPDHFGPLDCEDAIYGCQPAEDLPEPWRSAPFRAWWIPFEDASRGLYVFVAIGDDASSELRAQTWAVADSLAFVPIEEG